MRSLWFAYVGAALAALAIPALAPAQGLILPGAGAMHRSMAGASTAMGADAQGALFWNPAAISSLPHSEVVIGSEMILPDIHVASTFLGQAGDTRSDSGLVPTTGLGLVYRGEDSKLTYGLGIATLAAGGVNYPADAGNPIFAPPRLPVGGFILGPQAASLLVLAIEPTASYQLTDRLAVGFGPMIDVSVVSFDPAFFGPVTSAGVGQPNQFPTGSHTRPFWGGGFRAGTTYKVTDRVTAGFSYTSPQWFEAWQFNARTASGDPLNFETHFSLPQIFSAGVAYATEKLLVTTDLRWFDYRTTQLVGQPVVQGGANWDSVWAVALGAKYQMSERLSAQAGYLYNGNPVPSNLAFFNVQLPLITQHTISFGSHVQFNEWLGLSVAWVHGFENDVSGSLLQVLGGSTTIRSHYDSFVFGIHVTFGPGAKCDKGAEEAAQ